MKLIPCLLCLILLLPAVGGAPVVSGQTKELEAQNCLGGDLNAPIRVEVFSDFECPACREFYLNTIRPVLRDYCSVDKVCVIYREFPLQMHKYSRLAAQYSKASQRLGRKQWQAVMDGLYENQEVWAQNGAVDDVVFKALGSEDYFRIKRLMLDPSIETEIDAEVALGTKREVTSTPTFFVSAIGKVQKVTQALPYPVLKDFFDSIVK